MNKLSNYKNYDDWVVDILKKDKKRVDKFLKTALEEFDKDADTATLLIALRHVAQAKGGIAELSEKTKIGREALYKILSKTGNPTLTTFKTILNGLGCGFAVRLNHSVG